MAFKINCNKHYAVKKILNTSRTALFPYEIRPGSNQENFTALAQARLLGRRHTSPKNAIKGIPGHLIGEAKNAITELIKEGFVLTKPTNYGTQIYLNREKKSLIEAIINEK